LKSIRILRILRPLRLFSKIKSLRKQIIDITNDANLKLEKKDLPKLKLIKDKTNNLGGKK
jgi:hypothetical protein